MANKVHVGDYGTRFTLTITDNCIPVDISLATVKEIIFWAPDGSLKPFDATFVTDGVDGKIEYTTQDGDMDQKDVWYYRGLVQSTGKSFNSTVLQLVVYE